MKRQVLELTLDGLTLDVTGGGHDSRHLVTVGLIWPRPAIPEKIAVKIVDVKAGGCSLAGKPWVERILFKEVVEGPFGLKLAVSEPVSDSEVMEFMRFVGSAIFKTAGAEAADLAESAMAAGLIGIPFQYLSKAIGGSDGKQARTVAAGSLDLSAEELVRVGKKGPLRLGLKADQPFYGVARTRKHGANAMKRKVLLKAGQPNGEVVLSATVY